MPQWRFIGKDGQEHKLPPISLGDGSEAVPYPLIPFGTFVTPAGECFEVTPEIAQEMIANFREGLPNALGIPVDENQAHQKNPGGAYAWITDLEVRADGLWGTIKPTSEGLAHLDALPMISPHFTVGQGASPNYPGRRNFIEAAAACSSPWFSGQPGMVAPEGLRVMATMSTVGGDAPDATTTEPIGGDLMNPEELQAKIDELTAELAAKAEELTAKTTEIEGLQAQVTERDEKIATLETAQAEAKTEAEQMAERITALEQGMAEKDREAQVKAIVDGLQAEVLQETGADGEVEQRQYTPEAVECLAALQTDPGEASTAAFMAHIKANGGRPATVPITEKPALRPVRASIGGANNLTDEQKLEMLPEDDRRRVERLMQSNNCGFEQARRMDWEQRRPL